MLENPLSLFPKDRPVGWTGPMSVIAWCQHLTERELRFCIVTFLATIDGMKTWIGLLVACLCWSAWGQQQSASTSETGHVTNNVVFISPGEQFGVNLAGAAEGMPLSVSEEPDPKKANLVLRFRQEKGGMTLFTIENRTEHWLTYERV